MANLLSSAFSYAEHHKDYYSRWTFDQCYALSASNDLAFEKLHKILYKFIRYYISNHRNYSDFSCLSPRRRHILDIFQDSPCDMGTYRTDFVIAKSGQPKLIEITNRFPLNGIFETSFYYLYTNKLRDSFASCVQPRARFNQIYIELEKLASRYSKICILQGRSLNNSSRFYGSLFEAAGFRVQFYSIYSVQEIIGKLDDAWIISELTFSEIEQMPDKLLLYLSQRNILNDIKSVLLLHDKSFFSLITSPSIQASCLSEDERSYLNMFLVPSFLPLNAPAYGLDAALKNKDSWILKSRSLGKSSNIYAGASCTHSEWEALLLSDDVGEYILQEYVSQPKFKGSVGGEPCNDYATGTILMLNGIYGGLGHFRTSDNRVLGAGQEIHQLAVSIFSDDAIAHLNPADFIRDKMAIGSY